jgi:hypothetical protein
MRLAFILRLGNDSRPSQGLLEGSVEEVDTCTGIRFRSTEELLEFLGQRFDLATSSNRENLADDPKPSPRPQEMCRRRRRP